MKHLYKFSLLLLAFLIPATALSHDFEVDGIYYKINGTEATVTCKGTYYNSYTDEYSGAVTIPALVSYGGTTYSVTSIDEYTFYGCSGLTSIDIPNSVTSIGSCALWKCTGVTKITIGNSVTSIGHHAFSGCTGLTSITIPNSVTSIEIYAFSGCTGLTSIIVAGSNPKYDSRGNCNAIIETTSNTLILGCMNTVIPNSVTNISDGAFSGCSGLTSIDIPNSVTTIGYAAFEGCSGLTSITIGNSVTSIGYNVFNGCSGITDLIWNARNCSSMGSIPTSNIERVIIGNEVEILPNSFVSGSKISSVNIPNSVTSIGSGAFRNCSNLTSIKVETGNPKYDSRNNCNAIIMTATNALVVGCKNSIVPNSVTTISNSAFQNCSGLASIRIGNSVTAIGNYAFSGCTGLTSVTIGNSVTYIGSSAFSSCSSLASITIPNSVTFIGDGAFSGCNGLISIVVESGNSKYDSRNNCNAIIETATNTLILGCMNTVIPNSVSSIGDLAFYGCSALTSIDIPNSVTSIGGFAFSGCSGLASVTIGNSVTAIGIDAFSMESSSLTRVDISDIAAWCKIEFENMYANPLFCASTGHLYLNGSEITELTIPNSVTNIKDYAFIRCSGLTSVAIPNSVTTIGKMAFVMCENLTSITIGNSVKSIGDEAFASGSITEIYSLALIPPTINSFIFGMYSPTLCVYVYDIAMEAYQTADNWKDFPNIVGMPYTFEVDGKSYHATTLSTASVMANGDEGILYTGDVVIPDSVTYAGHTFAVTGIENNAFDGCFDLTNITIPNSVETIGEQAFQGCTGLKNLTIGSSVTALGAKAFNYCNALETVKCLSTVPPVMASADCFSTAAYNRATLLVPRQQIEAYQAADYWYKFAHIEGWGSAGRGDIDGDGEVSIRDVTTMIDAILTGEHEGVYFESADLNSNGRLDIGDVTSIIDMLLNGN